MMNQKQSESEFEKLLIEKLQTGAITCDHPGMNMDFNQIYRSQLWDYRPDIKTTAQLEENFKKILEKNNQHRLDRPLSQNEFRQVMDQINALSTPYKAGKFLYGMNGVSEVEVDLDDGRHVFLTVFDQSQIGAGNTVYQVVNQISRPAVIPGNPDRRFDVTLLINGLPIYQIELKNENVDVDEALNQLDQYTREHQFSGIFSTVQVLMGMTPCATKYMAATTADQFNKDFAFLWKDEKNRNVYNWQYIADHMLTIPAAHLLATNYMILDGTPNRESIKVMRPYQVAATRKAIDAVEHTDFDLPLNKDGYIWHTTGSGKTITSYKTASLATRLPNIDKVVFLVDRKSLTRQTMDSFSAYDPDSSADPADRFTSIEDTANTNALSRKLKAKGNDIIITSTQKMRKLVSREKFKTPDKNILFIVDEAHRSTGTETFGDIQKAFPHSAWIGYSGTPVFDENRKGSRTVDVFGNLLHAYTIRDAIADKNVLGFKVDFNTTVPDEEKARQLAEYYRKMHPEWSEEKIQKKIAELSPADMDDATCGSFYDNNKKHVEAVVKDIVDNWENRSVNGKYNALLTTHVGGNKPSIPMALMYYREFKEINRIREEFGLKPIKVAISVSMDETNGETMNEVNTGLKEAMDDYNRMFGTNFDATTFDQYTVDLESRLNKSNLDGNCLDLVIVVDRLLTGFDAPELNTLYVDRILKGANLIQAYSRTNRVHDMQSKPFGNIVNYRWPEYAESLMEDALAEYSNKDNANLSPEEKKKLNEDEGITAVSFKEQVEKTQQIIATIRKLTDNLDLIPDNPEKQNALLSAFRQYNGQIAKLKQYPPKKDSQGTIVEGYDYNDPDALLQHLGITEEERKLMTVTLPNKLKHEISVRDHIPVQLIDLRVEHLKDVYVNYDYLSELLESLMNDVHDNKMEEASQTKTKIHEFTDTMPNRLEAKEVNEATEAIYLRKYPTPSSGLSYPYRINSTKELMNNVRRAQLAFVDDQMETFRNRWGLQKIVDNGYLRQIISTHQYGEDDLDKDFMMRLAAQAMKTYQEMAEDPQIKELPKLRYRNRLKEALIDLADQQVSHE